MRPLAFEYPDDPNFVRNETQFMFGDDLLIAPVLQPHQAKREVRLPKGEWYDYWTGRGYRGNESVTAEAPIDRIPIFVKSGAILPTQQLLQYSDQAPIDPLTLTFYPADSSGSTYYEDDGHTFAYQEGSYWKRTIGQRRTAHAVDITLGKVKGSYRPPDRSLVLEILGLAKVPHKVQIAGAELRRAHAAALQERREGWSYDPAARVVRVKMRETSEERTVSILR
jgi:alpha-glucosidase